MKRRLQLFTIGFLAFLIILYGALTNYFSPYKLQANQVTDWSANWLYNNDHYTLEGQHIAIPSNTAYSISKDLPMDNLSNKYILFRGSLADVEVDLSGKTIYKSQRDTFLGTTAPPASLWHLVPLNNYYRGKNLTITYKSPYKNMSGLLNPVYLGYQGDLLFKLINQFGKAFAIDVLVLGFGILLLIFAFVTPRGINTSVWYVGLFSILVAIWLITESKMLQFFIGQQWINASLAYISIAIIPIPLLAYIGSITTKKNSVLIKRLIGLSILTLGAVVGLQALHIADFYETLVISHPVIVVHIIAISFMLLKELKHYKSRSALNFVISLLVLFAFILTEIFQFFVYNVVDVTIYVRIGLLAFIVMISFDALKQLLIQIENSYQASFFEELAYKDPLTEGNNRLAFDKHMEELFQNRPKLNNLQLVILDMNNLKAINDTFGHVMGDEAIKAAYSIIDRNFETLGTSYRIGGDEFAVIIEETDEEQLSTLSSNLYQAIKDFNQTVDYTFGIAFGSVKYDPNLDETAKKMLHRADNNMYIEKRMRYKTKRV